MAERRKRITFASEPRDVHFPLKDEHGHLERHLALDHAIRTLRQPHDGHATPTELSDEAVACEHHAFLETGGGFEVEMSEPVDDNLAERARMIRRQRGG